MAAGFALRVHGFVVRNAGQGEGAFTGHPAKVGDGRVQIDFGLGGLSGSGAAVDANPYGSGTDEPFQ
jgi:hypothetical protein